MLIRDSGPGLPDAVQAKIFEPFLTTKLVGKGTGMGLAMGYSVITETHQGQLTLNFQGGCTEFCIEIPREIPEKYVQQTATLLSKADV